MTKADSASALKCFRHFRTLLLFVSGGAAALSWVRIDNGTHFEKHFRAALISDLEPGSELIWLEPGVYPEQQAVQPMKVGPMLQHSIPENQQQNYVELWMQMVESAAKACLLESGLPLRFLYLARQYVVFHLRRKLDASSGRTVWELVSGFIPSFYHSYPWGCLVLAFARNKEDLAPNADLGVFMGYAEVGWLL